MLPGLIDTHAHLVFDASTDPAGHLQAVTDETLLADARQAAARALGAGVTGLRDLGDRSYLGVRLRDETAARPGLGPGIVPAGPPLTVPRGHYWFLGGVTRGAGIRAAVREHADRGVAVIKVMSTGGHTSGPVPDALAACQVDPKSLVLALHHAYAGSTARPRGRAPAACSATTSSSPAGTAGLSDAAIMSSGAGMAR